MGGCAKPQSLASGTITPANRSRSTRPPQGGLGDGRRVAHGRHSGDGAASRYRSLRPRFSSLVLSHPRPLTPRVGDNLGLGHARRRRPPFDENGGSNSSPTQSRPSHPSSGDGRGGQQGPLVVPPVTPVSREEIGTTGSATRRPSTERRTLVHRAWALRPKGREREKEEGGEREGWRMTKMVNASRLTVHRHVKLHHGPDRFGFDYRSIYKPAAPPVKQLSLGSHTSRSCEH